MTAQCSAPAALRTLATKAVSEKNLTLAAVLIAVNEERAREDQSFDSSALAEEAFGAECREALNVLKIASRHFEETYRSNRELETGRVDGLLSIGLGLKERTDPSPALADLEAEAA